MNVHLNPPLHLLAAFQQTYPDCTPTWVLQSPGRETWVAAMAADVDYSLASANHQAQTRFSRRSAVFKQTINKRPLPDWSRYAAGVIVTLSDAGLDVPGIRAVSHSEDTSFGPRHDHALGMAFAALWHEILGLPYTPEQVLEIVERVRRNYVER